MNQSSTVSYSVGSLPLALFTLLTINSFVTQQPAHVHFGNVAQNVKCGVFARTFVNPFSGFLLAFIPYPITQYKNINTAKQIQIIVPTDIPVDAEPLQAKFVFIVIVYTHPSPSVISVTLHDDVPHSNFATNARL